MTEPMSSSEPASAAGGNLATPATNVGLATPSVPLEEALSAVLNGAVWRGFDGPDGVSKDEALEYAGVLAKRVQAVLAFIAETGCLCDDGCYHASLPDHEPYCPAQIEHLLRTDEAND